MGEDKEVEKQVSPAVQQALDLANKANALKEKIEAAEASDSNDVDAVIKQLVQCLTQHTLVCRDLIGAVSEALAPGESSHYRRMQALEHLSQIDRLNEMLALKITHKISASRYDGMAVEPIINRVNKNGVKEVLTFPSGRLMMVDGNGKTEHYIKYRDIAKHAAPVVDSAFDRMANAVVDVHFEKAKSFPNFKHFFTKWEE